jgi:hypothetical protein
MHRMTDLEDNTVCLGKEVEDVIHLSISFVMFVAGHDTNDN